MVCVWYVYEGLVIALKVGAQFQLQLLVTAAHAVLGVSLTDTLSRMGWFIWCVSRMGWSV